MAADDRYRPGHRNRPTVSDGKMSENRAAWIKTTIGQWVLMLNPPSGDSPEKVGTDVVLFIPRPGARPVSFNLTALTVEELDSVEQFLTLLMQTARPVCEERDKVAQHALANGDDSHARVYRQAPQFIVRNGPQLADHQGLRLGFEGVPEVVQDLTASDGDVPEHGDELAQLPAHDRGTEDDRA